MCNGDSEILNIKFGVEIEFFGVDRPTVLQKFLDNGIDAEIHKYEHCNYDNWKITWDGSVTPDGTEEVIDLHDQKVYKGVEVVSPILYGEAGLKELEIVCKCLNEIDAKVDKTCGIHIHFNAGDMSVKDVKNILIFYYNNQKMFDAMLPESRRSGKCEFCKPIEKDQIIKIKKADSREKIGRALKTRHKVVNARSYRREGHNTIEFRQMNGSINYNKIECWILLLYKMIEYCINYEDILTIRYNLTLEQQINRTIKLLGIRQTKLSRYIYKRIKKFR